MGKGNLRLKTYCPEDVDLTKTQPSKYIVYMDRGNPSQELRVNYASSNMWLERPNQNSEGREFDSHLEIGKCF